MLGGERTFKTAFSRFNLELSLGEFAKDKLDAKGNPEPG